MPRDDDDSLAIVATDDDKLPPVKVDTRKVIKQIWPVMVAVFLVFMVTLCLFPAVVSQVRSTSDPASVLFVPLAFLLFSVGDWLGKVMPQWFAFANKGSRARGIALLVAASLRLVFVPLLAMSNVLVVDDARVWPYAIKSDWLVMVIVAVFAVSNGYLGSLCMLMAPQLVTTTISDNNEYSLLAEDSVESAEMEAREKGVAGALMVFALTTGLTVGSLLSFVVRSSLCAWCNPLS